MKQNKTNASSARRPVLTPASPTRKPKPAFKLTPAEREVEVIRKRRRELWRELGSLEAVEELGRKVREDRMSAKKSVRKRSA
jgi:hypothetical protein